MNIRKLLSDDDNKGDSSSNKKEKALKRVFCTVIQHFTTSV
jgi:hypothetical protein